MQGHVDSKFENVRDVLAQSFEAGENLGATVAVMIEGETVISLAGGYQDKAKTLPFAEDTLTCVFSSGKAVCAALVMHAVSEGKLDYDQTVASIWPEFGQAGKQDITVAQALSHQAGLSGFVEEQDPKIWLDWDATCAALAAMEPLWEPGTASGYHPQTYGYIAGEILRRVNEGQTVGQQLRKLTRDVICGMGLTEATRAAPLVKPKKAPDLGELDEITKAAFLKPWSAPSGVSRQDWAAAEIPASNMHANARGLAEVMQLFATGKALGLTVSEKAREAAWQERISGHDKVLPFNLSWAAGVMRENGGIFGAPPTAIGHYGFGGSCVVADPARGLSFAFVPNQQSEHLVADPRAVALIRAVYQAVA